MKTIAVMTTAGDRDEAARIADALVGRRLAACVQISKIESAYSWQGEVRHDREYRLLVKTTEERYADVEAAIRELHSYDLPAIFALPMSHVYEPFGDWIIEQSSPENGV